MKAIHLPKGSIRSGFLAGLAGSRRYGAVVAAACLALACDRSKPPPSESARRPDTQADVTAFSYPRARWRLATFDELDRSTVWLSHIAVRHRESDADWFRRVGWIPDPPAPERSASEALTLANELAAQLAKKPEDFARLARERSDDVVSREHGGSLGGVRTSQLPPEFLDALATLQPGEISRVFRTPYGFHLIQRRPTPADTQLSGMRIAIGYRGTLGSALGAEPRRTRRAALDLARVVSAQAKKGDVEFAQLVEKYSDNVDKARSGDLGVRSLRDPEYLPREVEILSELSVGEVSEPVDSRFGFEILKRTAATDRPRYAMEAIELKFDPTRPEGEHSRSATLTLARQLQSEVRRDPGLFRAFQERYCCAKIKQWTLGRGPLGVAAHLEGLAFGEIAPEPILHDWFYLIVRRLDPGQIEPEAPRRYDVPSPERPDFEAFLENNDGRMIASITRALIEEIRRSQRFEPATTTAIADRLSELAFTLEQNAEDPKAMRHAVDATKRELEQRLGTDGFATFGDFATQWAVSKMLE